MSWFKGGTVVCHESVSEEPTMKKVAIVVGTRPEAIKMAPVIHELRKRPESFSVSVCLTAQHREMLDQVVELFALRPDHDLDIMKKRQSLTSLTASILQRVQPILTVEKPDYLLVQGDTTTAFASALAAFYEKIPVGHVEAGLRTYHKYAPFPEEINRKLVASLADYHFAPTPMAKAALEREGVDVARVVVTGNTVIDALFLTLEKIKAGEVHLGSVANIVAENPKIVLVTGHRRESFGQGFQNICGALADLAAGFPDYCFVYPVHLNPNIQEPVRRMLGKVTNILLLPPLDYAPFVYLMNACYLILTDSGGIQEEAPSLGKPVLVMREVTERTEAIEAGTARLVGTNRATIVSAATRLLTDAAEWKRMRDRQNPFGDGRAAVRIADYLAAID